MKISKKFSFEASHCLPDHDGKCKNQHGHTYFVEVCIEGIVKGKEAGVKRGFVMDFHDVRKGVDEVILSKYDHSHLNDSFEYPTAELMALKMYRDLADWLNKNIKGVTLHSVKLWETPNSHVEVDFETMLQEGCK